VWIWLRIVNEMNLLRSIQREFVVKRDEWRKEGLVAGMITTFHGRSPDGISVEPFLYVCVEMFPHIDDTSLNQIELTDEERSQIPAFMSDYVDYISKSFRMPLYWDGSGITQYEPPHVSVGEYMRAVVKTAPLYGMSHQDIVRATAFGSDVGISFLQDFEHLPLKDTPTLKALAKRILRRIASEKSLTNKEKTVAFHMACASIPFLIPSNHGVRYIDSCLQ